MKLSVAGESTVDIAVVDETAPKKDIPETLVLTASIKPFINFVWGGTLIMVSGFFLALLARYRRIKSESRKINAISPNGNGSHKQGSKQQSSKEHADKN
jgi:cytochrome c biogenesis factor